MSTATQQLIQRIQVANGNCTAYRVAKLLGVTRSTLSLWVNGKAHMSPANIIAACKSAGEKDVGRWQMFIGAERERGPDGDFFRDMRDDLIRVERGLEPHREGWLYKLIHGLPKSIQTVASVALACGLVAHPAPSEASTSGVTQIHGQSIHYANYEVTRRRLRRRFLPSLSAIRQAFMTWFPAEPVPA